MKIVFMGSPSFAVPSLEALHGSTHEVVAVVTQPDRPSGRSLILRAPAVKLAAHKLGLPVIQPTTTKTQQFLDEIGAFRPDVLVVVAYGEILKPALLDLPPRGAVNLHASLLPKYRGAAPVPWAIQRGEAITGATTILVSEKMDAGPIFLQESCSIHPSDTSESLLRRISLLGAPLLKQTIDFLENNDMTPRPQDDTQVSFAPKLKKEDGWVDWNKPADWISRQIRAFEPWPGTFSNLNEMQVKFWLSHPLEEMTSEQPGTILRVQKQGILLACGSGTVLQVLELQPQNKARLTAADFVNGYHIQPGQRFVSIPP
jgi:methionyl-tRNA formyltransferase